MRRNLTHRLDALESAARHTLGPPVVAELPDGRRFALDPRVPRISIPPAGLDPAATLAWQRSRRPAWRRLDPVEADALGPDARVHRVSTLAAFSAAPFLRETPPGSPDSPGRARPADLAVACRAVPMARSDQP